MKASIRAAERRKFMSHRKTNPGYQKMNTAKQNNLGNLQTYMILQHTA